MPCNEESHLSGSIIFPQKLMFTYKKGHILLTLLAMQKTYFFYLCMCFLKKHVTDVILFWHQFYNDKVVGRLFHINNFPGLSISQAIHLHLGAPSIPFTRIVSFITFSPVSSGSMPECIENFWKVNVMNRLRL